MKPQEDQHKSEPRHSEEFGQGVGWKMYILAVFAFGWKGEVVTQSILVQIAGVNVYALDLVLVVCVWAGIRWLRAGGWRTAGFDGKLLALLVGWLCLQVLRGLPVFGYRALGESRYLLPVLTYFIPSLVLGPGTHDRKRNAVRAIGATAAALAVGAGLTLCESYLLGLPPLETTDDFRGDRYLTGNQTYYLVMFAAMLLLKRMSGEKSPWSLVLLAAVLLAAIISKNRSPFVALGLGFVALLIFQRRILLLIKTVGITVGIAVLLLWSLPSLRQDLSTAFGGILDPVEDPTGRWRIAIQIAALEQGLEHPWLGEGFGGYFNFFIPSVDAERVYELPPHNQFLLYFLKAGLPAVLLSVGAIVVFVLRSHRTQHRDRELRNTWVFPFLQLLIGSHLIYGLAYDFFPFFGLFFAYGVILSDEGNGQRMSIAGSPNPLQKAQ